MKIHACYYIIYKTERFIIDVVVEKGVPLSTRESIVQLLFEEGFLTDNGSAFESDIINDVLDDLNWKSIIEEITTELNNGIL